MLTLLQGGQAPAVAADIEARRDAAAAAIADAYAAAVDLVHPLDVEERAWYAERLRDARLAAGMPTRQPPPRGERAGWALVAQAAARALRTLDLEPVAREEFERLEAAACRAAGMAGRAHSVHT